MKRGITTLNDIKQAVMSLKGESVELHINRGRRKVLTFNGIIDNVYTSVFTVKDKIVSTLTHTYSYSDILCGEVKINKIIE
ncbi:MAG: Veg family protein [Clostridia bacterium]